MKRFILLVSISFFYFHDAEAQKSFKWDGDWISVQVFDVKSEKQEFIIKGKKLSILQLFYDLNLVDSTNTADSAKAQFSQSKKMVDYQLIETVYLDKTQEKGYHVLYFEESKKYGILTFKKMSSGDIISNGRIEYPSDTKEDAIANLNKSITESSELMKKMLPNQTTEIDMVYDLGFIYRKKEKYDLYNSYTDVQFTTKEELIAYVDKIIEFCKKENYNKNLGPITVINFLILLDKMSVLDKNNPYTAFKKISTAFESFKGDQKVSAKFVELQEQTGLK